MQLRRMNFFFPSSLLSEMNSDTTRAFLAGVLIPTIAYYFLLRRNQQQLRQLREEYEEDDDDDDLFEDVEDDDDEDENEDTKDKTLGPSELAASKWGRQHAPYKMLLIVNTELNMGKGKIAAQCGHAAVGCYDTARRKCPAAVQAWYRTGCAKIALKCSSTEELLALAQLAQQKYRIPYYLVEDAGRTQIAAGSRTVLGLFAPAALFEGFTSHLKLM
jgi:peptidyl-tRNA hydrolase, PTH2 family